MMDRRTFLAISLANGLRAALAGRFRTNHAFLVGQLLTHLDYLDEAIGTLSTESRGISPLFRTSWTDWIAFPASTGGRPK
jgi:hypothetical protein